MGPIGLLSSTKDELNSLKKTGHELVTSSTPLERSLVLSVKCKSPKRIENPANPMGRSW